MSVPIPPRADLGPIPPEGRPLATWSAFHSLAIFLLGNVLIGQALLGAIILFVFGAVTVPTDGATTPILVASLFADLAMVGTILVWLRLRHEPTVALLGMPAPGRWLREIWIGAASGILLYLVVGFGAANLISWVLERLFNQPIVTPHQLSPGLSTAGKVLAAFLAVVIAPASEELFFRGVLFRGLRDRRGFPIAAGVSAVVFGSAHWEGQWRGALVLVLSMVVTGLGLASLYDRRKNLVSNIAAHAAFNIIGVILLFGFPRFGT